MRLAFEALRDDATVFWIRHRTRASYGWNHRYRPNLFPETTFVPSRNHRREVFEAFERLGQITETATSQRQKYRMRLFRERERDARSVAFQDTIDIVQIVPGNVP